MKEETKGDYWKNYRDYCRKKFIGIGVLKPGRIIITSYLPRPVKYKTFVKIVLERWFENDYNKFYRYLDFVYKEFMNCKNAAPDRWPNWVGSPKMVKRFIDGGCIVDKSTISNELPKSDTYSDHSAVGECEEDDEFDTVGLW